MCFRSIGFLLSFSVAACLLPQVALADGVDPGEYACVTMLLGSNDTSKNTVTSIVNIDGERYEYKYVAGKSQPSGAGAFDFDGKKLRWTSGPLRGQPDGEFEYDVITVQKRLTVYIRGNEPQLCYL